MPGSVSYDVVVVGSGPNGLAAAIRLAQEKLSVLVLEGKETLGGSAQSAELTVPGFLHDVCSAIHPLGAASPFFCTLSLEKYGLHWIQPEFPLAHPLGGGEAAVLRRSVSETASGLGQDNQAYQRLFYPLADRWEEIGPELLQPILHWPRHPLQLARFGWRGLRPAASLARSWFAGDGARALFCGMAAHSFLPLEQRPSAAFGLVLGLLGHAAGWPLPRGGSGRIADSLAACLRALGGEIALNSPVANLNELPLARAVLLDVTPRQALALAGHKLPDWYRRRLQMYRYGPGVFKLDYALSSPIPWKSPVCRKAGTVHVGGTLVEIAASERAVNGGQHAERPFVIVTQPSLFDETRAPKDKHIAWAYCHVPNGSSFDMTERIENQIERFAPGFRDCILARCVSTCADFEQDNPNLVGGDINGGAADLRQLVARPIFSAVPYRTPVPGLFLCSASTPPAGGVHGMCGFHAAEAAWRDCFNRGRTPP